MWKKLLRTLATFPSAVITGVDSAGYPFSIRCFPRVDSLRKVLQIDIPAGIPIQPGLAGLMCHSHDERLWRLRSFLVQGRLDNGSEGWFFVPERFIAGEGLGGQLSLLRVLFQVRQRTRRYLEKRGLPRPKIPWDAINVLRDESRKMAASNGRVPTGDNLQNHPE